jgi:hypothetical protein
MEKKKKINWEQIFVNHTVVSAVTREEFVSVRMSCSYNSDRLMGVVFNVHAPSEETSDHSKDNFMWN